jgi:hypothetical protein
MTRAINGLNQASETEDVLCSQLNEEGIAIVSLVGSQNTSVAWSFLTDLIPVTGVSLLGRDQPPLSPSMGLKATPFPASTLNTRLASHTS